MKYFLKCELDKNNLPWARIVDENGETILEAYYLDQPIPIHALETDQH